MSLHSLVPRCRMEDIPPKNYHEERIILNVGSQEGAFFHCGTFRHRIKKLSQNFYFFQFLDSYEFS